MTVKGLTEAGLKHYEILKLEKSEIIKRLNAGVYARFNENPDVFGAVYALQNDLTQSSHIGGRTALSLVYGKAQYASSKRIEIFSYKQEKLPTWFKNLYSPSIVQFMTDFLPATEGLTEWHHDAYTIQVSMLERALLELLYLVPNFVMPQEALEIMQLVTAIKPSAMQNLLEKCKSIKTKRLFLCFAELCGHQWFSRIEINSINLGTGVREITKGGKLYSKYNLVLPGELETL